MRPAGDGYWRASRCPTKVAAGFTNSASVNGDKFATIEYFRTLSQQHAYAWTGTGLLPSNTKAHGAADVDWTAGFGGALAASPSDLAGRSARTGDLETARLPGRRVAESPRSRRAEPLRRRRGSEESPRRHDLGPARHIAGAAARHSHAGLS